jgi:LuxR family maltose regulon positive regulatory protein
MAVDQQGVEAFLADRTVARLPPPPHGVVDRPRLYSILDEALERPLTLIAAPAGFGKTTLLQSWLAARPDLDVAWLTSDDVSDDQSFWASVLAAVDGAAAAGAETPFDQLLRTLEERPGRVVIVVDDFQRIRSRAVLGPLTLLLNRAPAGVHVILATRRDPALPLHRLRLAGHLTELRARDLAFRLDEAAEFFSAAGLELSPELVHGLLARTEGWAAALRFAAISLQTHGEAESFVRALTRTEHAVAEYLVAEVLGAQPARVREFLLSTAICDRIDGGLADELTGRTDGARTLAALERDNVFVELEPDGRWYRYHSLFAELLRTEACREPRERIRELHLRAARRLAAEGDRLDALQHALAAGDAQAANDLVAHLWVEVDGRGDDALARAIIDRIEPNAASDQPHLCLLAAWERLRHGDPPRADAWLKLADTRRRSLGPADRAAFDFGRSVIELRRARLVGDLPALDRALKRFARPTSPPAGPHDDDGRRALMLCSRALADAWNAELGEASTALEAALDAARRTRLGALQSEVASMLSLVCAFRGDLTRAARLARPVLAELEGGNQGRHEFVAALLALSRCSLDWDDDEEARNLAERARQIAEAVGDQVGRPAARVLSLEAVAATPGGSDVARLELAALALEEGLERIPALVRPVVDLVQARLARVDGDAEAAGAALRGHDEPQYAVALARSALVGDDLDRACALLEPIVENVDASKVTVVEAAVLRGIAAERQSLPDDARAWIEHGLEVAEPDAIRRPFTHTGPEVSRILRRAIRQGTAHRWLAGSLLAVLDGREGREGHETRELLDPLSTRETVILRYLPTLLSNQEIAGELFVSVNTVKTHLKSIYRKLGVSDRREAVRIAREMRLVGSRSP